MTLISNLNILERIPAKLLPGKPYSKLILEVAKMIFKSHPLEILLNIARYLVGGTSNTLLTLVIQALEIDHRILPRSGKRILYTQEWLYVAVVYNISIIWWDIYYDDRFSWVDANFGELDLPEVERNTTWLITPDRYTSPEDVIYDNFMLIIRDLMVPENRNNWQYMDEYAVAFALTDQINIKGYSKMKMN
ncbi:hypothetical protein MUCCIDRAFT_166329 [Mucor lusitanicus CBS 277.49]|uniref:Uncharacterized protein n=1 Tax=Mucor lusitanicus CBS 277.49 TaxID=747725 RepID=A0A168IZA4_MUCCL|nr:hypothetical protein MUCCIDRAFT_166329 [Mucor lusitanicus CBS 277.49]